jgi:hypothetical protein
VRIARTLGALACFSLLVGFAEAARGQSPDAMLPEQSEAKARQVLQQAIQALGGKAYLEAKDLTCSGRLSGIAHNGESTGSVKFTTHVKLPDKDLTEYVSRIPYTDIFLFEVHATGRSIVAHNGDKGWTVDGQGIQELPADALSQYREDHNRTINVILHQRLNEPGLKFRWAGTEIIDLRRVGWVEIDDGNHRVLRAAFDEQTRLPSRLVYETLDPATRERNEETETFANFHNIQGVVTPFQRTRERNGFKFSQIFYDECTYNTGLPDSMFTRDSLSVQFAKLAKGKK